MPHRSRPRIISRVESNRVITSPLSEGKGLKISKVRRNYKIKRYRTQFYSFERKGNSTRKKANVLLSTFVPLVIVVYIIDHANSLSRMKRWRFDSQHWRGNDSPLGAKRKAWFGEGSDFDWAGSFDGRATSHSEDYTWDRGDVDNR